MKAIQLVSHGFPAQACQCVDVPEPELTRPVDIKVKMMASAINPADLLIFENRYPGPEVLPAQVGIEGAGIVVETGTDVSEFAVGDHVLSLGRSNWAEFVVDEASRFIPLPKALSWQDAAQLKANPPSAHLMLTDYVDLDKGDWVIQNAANSAVGRHVISFCKARGLRSVNLVRKQTQVQELEQLGADCVLVDEQPAKSGNISSKVRTAIGDDANVRLGIDAIGGKATAKLADCLSNSGTVVNYGFLSGDPCEFTPYHTIIHNLTLKGFWLVGFMQRSERQQIIDMYQQMSSAFINKELNVPVEAQYALTDSANALAHAASEHRTGKILFDMTLDTHNL